MVASERERELSAVLGTMSHLASLRVVNGEVKEAVDLCSRVLEISENVLDQGDEFTLPPLERLAATLLAAGELESASRLAENLVTTSRKILGEMSEGSLRALNLRTKCLRALGDRRRALKVQQEVALLTAILRGDRNSATFEAVHSLVDLQGPDQSSVAQEAIQASTIIAERIHRAESDAVKRCDKACQNRA